MLNSNFNNTTNANVLSNNSKSLIYSQDNLNDSKNNDTPLKKVKKSIDIEKTKIKERRYNTIKIIKSKLDGLHKKTDWTPALLEYLNTNSEDNWDDNKKPWHNKARKNEAIEIVAKIVTDCIFGITKHQEARLTLLDPSKPYDNWDKVLKTIYIPGYGFKLNIIEEVFQELVGKELSNQHISWMWKIHILNFIRSNCLMWRGEKWIKKVINLANFTLQDLWNINEKKGVVYIMLNCKTKKMIVGSTSRTAIHRFQQHLRGRSDTISKKAARYIVNLGPNKWIILPLEYTNDMSEKERILREAYWQRRFKNYLINRPIELLSVKPTKNTRIYHRQHELNRAEQKKKIVIEWRKYINLILNTNLWKDWHSVPLLNLLTNINKARINEDKKKEVNFQIQRHLRNKKAIPIQSNYKITNNTKFKHTKN